MTAVRSPSLVALALGVLFAPLAAQQGAVAPHGSLPAAEMEALRKATQRFKDIEVALAEGYVLPMEMCVTAEDEGAPRQLGAMGLHFIRPDLLGITGEDPRVDGNGTHTDFTSPSVLIYEPQSDGSLELVAIENLVWQKAWKEAGHESLPEFHGNQYYPMMDNPLTAADEAHGFEPHYELHFWLYRDNPTGAFSPFNPAVSCEHYQPGSAGER